MEMILTLLYCSVIIVQINMRVVLPDAEHLCTLLMKSQAVMRCYDLNRKYTHSVSMKSNCSGTNNRRFNGKVCFQGITRDKINTSLNVALIQQ